MRISVACGGFDDAADACRTANHIVALLSESLAGKLAGFAGMAGDDASSAEFAGSYDAAAAEAVDSLADLTHAFIGLGRLLSATGVNHASAEAAAAEKVLAYTGRGLTDDAFVRVALLPPPSSLGADEPSFGVVDRWILDQVEGFVWPGADVALLRDAAQAWRRAASGVAVLVDHVDVATRMIEHQRSPEVPAVLASLADVRSLVCEVAAELAALGAACDEYAVAVEDVHARTRALLAEIAKMVVEGAAISVIIGGLTGGLGGSATAAAAAARIRAQAPRFHALLIGLRTVAAAGAARLRAARDALRGLRARLDRYARVRVRDERGEMLLPGGWRTTVRAQDDLGGHILERHVGKSVEELAERAAAQNLDLASSFDDAASAEKYIAQAMSKAQAKLDAWLERGKKRLQIDELLDEATGISVDAAGVVHRVHGVRIILVRTPDSPSGYRVLTAFPQP
jgi:hypothetical protein